MLLWVGLAGLTVIAALAVLVPLWRASRQGPEGAGSDGGNDLLVYKDQLAEIGRDRDAGLIGADEAEAARIEVARRLLKAGRAAPGTTVVLSPAIRRVVTVLVVALIPAISLALYLKVGTPDMADQPLAAREQKPLEALSPAELIARVEAMASANPDDGRTQEFLARIYYRTNRMEEAAIALRNAIRLLGSTADREAMLGEVIVNANEGVVTADAREAFERVLALEPKAVGPRMYLALAKEQDGKKDEALAAWKALEAEAKGDESWLKIARDQIAKLEGREPEPDPAAPPPAMSAEEKAMVEGMVTRLADRLEKDGGTVDQWVQLMRSYRVLGRLDDAKAVVAKARIAMKDNADALQALEGAATQLGVTP